VRNVVTARATAAAPPLDAIVEEFFRAPEDLLDPLRFFGGLGSLRPHKVRGAHHKPKLKNK
jgi:hypothetical protein